MSSNLQPKGLYELAFGSFVTYMENKAQKLMKLDPTPEAVTVTSRACNELKRFFHGTRLPFSMSNHLTKHLLIKLNSMYYMLDCSIRTECCQQMLLSLVEVFMHPDVTAIELGTSYFHGFDFYCNNFISSMILEKVHNLYNLKVLNLPADESPYQGKEDKLVFPSQLRELTVRNYTYYSTDDILSSIVEFCPELKILNILSETEVCDVSAPLILQCKHLEILRISSDEWRTYKVYVDIINGLSTDATSDVLSATTLKSFRSIVLYQSTLNLIVDKLPHLTEIELVCEGSIDLSSLTQLKDLRSLSLTACYMRNTNEYRMILPVLGKNLVSLEIKECYILDLELIAETCTCLKSLRFYYISVCTEVNFTSEAFENFKTVEDQTVRFSVAFNNHNDACDLAEFLIAKCTNIKTLIIDMQFTEGTFEEPLYRTIEDVLRRTPPLNWILIKHVEHDKFVESLLSRHPNFRVVKSPYWTSLCSQAEVFDSFGCYI